VGRYSRAVSYQGKIGFEIVCVVPVGGGGLRNRELSDGKRGSVGRRGPPFHQVCRAGRAGEGERGHSQFGALCWVSAGLPWVEVEGGNRDGLSRGKLE